MADKMMRVAGRGTDGTAKALKTNDNGVLLIENKSAERYQLSTAITVLANDVVAVEIPLSIIESPTKSLFNYTTFDLSWLSSDGFGGDLTEVTFIYHRLSGQVDYNSITFQKTLNSENGLESSEGNCYFINNKDVQSIRNNFLTVIFKNNSSTNKGVYYPTIIFKK